MRNGQPHNPVAGGKNVQQVIATANATKGRRVVRGGSWSFNAKSVRVGKSSRGETFAVE